MYIEIGDTMIRIGENYLENIVRTTWEAFESKFQDEVAKIARQGNNILNFCYVVHRLLTTRDANTSLVLRQKEVIKDLEQLQLYNWNQIKLFYNNFLALIALSKNYCYPTLGE